MQRRRFPEIVRMMALVALFAAGLPGCRRAAPEVDGAAIADTVPRRIHPFVPLRDRSARIEWQRDLIIAERGDDLDYALGEAVPQVAVADGRIYVLDTSGFRVQVFDRDGAFLFSFGSRGQGPCEFDFDVGGLARLRPAFAFAGERLFILSRPSYVSVWDRQGDCLGELQTSLRLSRFSSARFAGVGDGRLVAQYRGESPESGNTFADIAAQLEERPEGSLGRAREYAAVGLSAARLAFAVHAPDSVYIAERGDDRATQRLIAFDVAGAARWVVEIPWPPRLMGFTRIKVDTQGHIYLFFGNRQDDGDGQSVRLVDVFDRDGERLIAATMEQFPVDRVWQVSDGEFVYGVDQDEQTGEWRVLRSRLLEPF